MAYDAEKYREKREKVLGIRKRGVGFTTLAAIVSLVILAGMGAVTVPKAMSYLATRHLDDAIFKSENHLALSEEMILKIYAVPGVSEVKTDMHDSRLVVTFDRRKAKSSDITAVFEKNNVGMILLNEFNHRRHQNLMAAEAKESETP